MFKYSRYYSGQEPEFIEGDIFKIIVPLDDEYSYDFETNRIETDIADKVQKSADKTQGSADKLQHKLVLEYVEKNGKITSRQAEELLNVKQRRAREVLSKMVDNETLMKETGGNHHPSVRRRTEGGTSGHREQYIKYV